MGLFSVGQRGLAAAAGAIRGVNDAADRGTRRAITITALNVQTKAKLNLRSQNAIDTSRLWRAIKVSYYDNGLRARIGDVEAAVSYGSYVEQGARFGSKMPPPAALADWARRHGLPNGFVVARAIQKRGYIPARPFLVPAWADESAKLPDRVKAEIAREVHK